jgi:preprotein translocase subunit SecY
MLLVDWSGTAAVCFAVLSLIIFFSFFYTALMYNPREVADNLKKGGAYLPGITSW